ncbi:hypothetical protein J056_002226 [Wallemia ichthyophaga EXF-994]|uniref:RRM domain-containing protein n=1 Tax=Wallemia ichthyophaga (strain EXF-994 / CBS 113033) TaxID=1299270 RepID=R9APN7_WALI9|nr:uncharacterized protein J056_002226 [Wallemia ichthyophaga EXF-994]EOR04148.1 hypothetical protein J056_002226 [Wallemia ichthyophaga EXF-994]
MRRHLGLLVKNLPPHLPEPGVKQFFEKHAQVKDMYLFRRSPFGGHSGQSLVHFASASELAKALQLNGRLLHNYKLHIEPTVQEAHEVDFPADGQRPIRYKFRSPLLYVTGQPLEATEEELVVAFRRFGAVRWVQNFHRDRKKFAHAYAFVLYDSPQSATKAYENGVYWRSAGGNIQCNTKLKLSFFKRPIKYPSNDPLKLGFEGNSRIFKHPK